MLSNLNKKQYEAATYMGSPLLILAGAGSGKTTTLISRVAYLISQGVKPEEILLLTFTNKAAQEMIERAEKELDESVQNITACTFHSFCNRELRQYAKYAGYKENFLILTPSEVEDAIGLMKSKYEEKYKKNGFPTNKELAFLFSVSINKDIPLDDVIYMYLYDYYRAEIHELKRMLNKYKKENFLMDYDDLLLEFNRLLISNQNIRNLLQHKYTHVLVDEYQDTNKLQESILFNLNTSNLSVVGDDYQSLYGFRGAEIENILMFPQKFEKCKVVTLSENYRSGQEILDLANNVMQEYATFGYKKMMHGQFELKRKPEMLVTDSAIDEANAVFKIIKNKIEIGIPANEIAVLSRMSHLFLPLENLLVRNGIEYEKYGGMKFLELKPVLDIISYLKCLVNPNDQLAWYRILKLYPGIGDKFAGKISEKNNANREFLLDENYKKNQFYKELINIKTLFDEAEKKDYQDTLNHFIEHYRALRMRVFEETKFRSEDRKAEEKESLERDRDVLDELYDIASEYGNVIDFLDSLTLEQNREKKGESLVLSTIHSIKGLEYNTIIILECVDGVFPRTDFLDMGTPTDMEELRCFYVALTRAKKNLYISCPETARIKGQYQNAMPTHFLDGMDQYFDTKRIHLGLF